MFRLNLGFNYSLKIFSDATCPPQAVHALPLTPTPPFHLQSASYQPQPDAWTSECPSGRPAQSYHAYNIVIARPAVHHGHLRQPQSFLSRPFPRGSLPILDAFSTHLLCHPRIIMTLLLKLELAKPIQFLHPSVTPGLSLTKINGGSGGKAT